VWTAEARSLQSRPQGAVGGLRAGEHRKLLSLPRARLADKGAPAGWLFHAQTLSPPRAPAPPAPSPPPRDEILHIMHRNHIPELKGTWMEEWHQARPPRLRPPGPAADGGCARLCLARAPRRRAPPAASLRRLARPPRPRPSVKRRVRALSPPAPPPAEAAQQHDPRRRPHLRGLHRLPRGGAPPRARRRGGVAALGGAGRAGRARRRAWAPRRRAPGQLRPARGAGPRVRAKPQGAFRLPTLHQSNGNEGAYWRVLSDAGITRQRLESFDRAIKTAPQFWPEKKARALPPPTPRDWRACAAVGAPPSRDASARGPARATASAGPPRPHLNAPPHTLPAPTPQGALIQEFRNYLGILKSVHSGADLQVGAPARLFAGARLLSVNFSGRPRALG
jgi:hypothetical protein